MSLAVAIPFGVASATVYGGSIVVQHRTAQQHAGEQGASSAHGLLRLMRNPAWLLAIGGDFIGFLLQIVALSNGPVVIIQPLVVLMLPVSLAVSAGLGWHRIRRSDYLGVVGVLGGLVVFLCLIGQPRGGHVPRPRYLALAVGILVVAGLLLSLVARRTTGPTRGAVYGAAAGGFFGALAVFIDAASERLSRRGFEGLLATPRGLVLIAAMLVVGVSAMTLTALSFQTGSLAATLPANLATDPLTAVLLGALLLREHIPHSPAHVVMYAACLVAVVAGAIQLARAEEDVQVPVDASDGSPEGDATLHR